MVGRDNIGYDEVMEARTRVEGAWGYDDYKLLLRYTNVNIKSVDVATIADQEEVNMDVSRKIYDRVGSTHGVPVIVAQERHPDRLDRDVKRGARDADKLRNAARFAFRNFWG